jgi:ribonucleoside-diphosphate reductase alpha chain
MFPSDSAANHSSNGHSGLTSAAQLGFGFAERRVSVLHGVEEVALPTTIVKRDGRIVPFDPMRIERAISRCFAALGRQPFTPIPELAVRVVNIMSARLGQPSVEVVQDAVELTLQAAGEFEAAKAYILYRAEHAKQRQERPIPDEVRAAFAQAEQYFPTALQKFQFFDKYSRFDYDKGRRETWIETVDRSVSFLHELVETNTGVDLGAEVYARLRRMILQMKSMPSMRLLAMAGPPARRDSTAIYNCSYQPVDSIDSFAEGLLISMAGCGVGFSVESRYVEHFPRVQRQRGLTPARHLVEDSAQGWAAAVRAGMQAWFEGGDVEFDYGQVRSAGIPLRIKGGRASGPAPLKTMLEFARARILARQGMHLRPIDAHDIMCMVGNAAVSGGVRRTAMISLFDYDDRDMRLCKSGDFERDNSQRWNANNSAVWPERGLDQVQVIEQVLDMVKSQRGEPGIFNRQAVLNLIPERRKRSGYQDYGTNPCGEIVLRANEFCNLSIAVARSEDTLETLKDKVEVATIIGTIQSLATHFPDLRPIWKQNSIEERLLGVDITGQMDSAVVHDPEVMWTLREVATETNRVFAERLGINQSAAITTVKPSGNSSQLLNCSSGLHARWAPYYERNVRVAATSPIFKVLRDAGVPMDPENGQTVDDANCVTPETKVLTDSLIWVAAGDLKEGDGIVGFEDLPEIGKKRHYRRATITYAGRKLSPVLRITLDDGTVLRCTPDHKWLTLDAGGTANWMTAEEILRKSRRKNFRIRLPRYWNVYDTDTSYGAGYLAGLLDGEGCVGAVERTTNIGFIQNEAGVYQRGLTELRARGYQVVTRTKQNGFAPESDSRQVAVVGGRTELLRLLSEARPIRLVDKLVRRIHTLSLVAFQAPGVSSVDEEGVQEIAVLSSSCQTYIAEGFGAHNTWVIHFPVKSPDGAVTRKDRGAIEQCNYWLHNKVNWTDHNPSITVTYKPDEIVALTSWIWEHRDMIGGMAFLPSFDAQYAQLPYIEISQADYERRVADFPEIDFSKIWRYESTDLTTAAQELACLAGQCEVEM